MASFFSQKAKYWLNTQGLGQQFHLDQGHANVMHVFRVQSISWHQQLPGSYLALATFHLVVNFEA
jgi:hypothetical protein